MTVTITFHGGTLEIRGLSASERAALPLTWDPRTRCARAPAMHYAGIVMALVECGIAYRDEARQYGELQDGLQVRRAPRPYQSEALAAWRHNRGRGLVVLPTGAGKTHVAMMAIDAVRRDTLVVVPTLDLLTQWYDGLRACFRRDVGVIGGGEYQLESMTVTTYDSAYLHAENLGARFGMLVFDECHHLPSEAYALAAQACLAPYRLGLSATPERPDGRHERLADLVGPVVYRQNVANLRGDYLADYRVEQILVQLTCDERRAYDEARAVYRDFVVRQGIRMHSPDGWSQFVMRSSRSAAGRKAMQAYGEQRRLAFAAPSKLGYVDHLLRLHCRDRVLLFADSNASAYAMARGFLVPIITHQTKVRERSEILADFANGTYNVVATSRVLNEGVDVPAANVGIVISGSGSVREHVQRLGRLLRKQGDKEAVLYELVASGTSEVYTSNRRREHDAYH